MTYKENISELFRSIPSLLPPKKLNDYQKNIKAEGVEWYIYKINANLLPIKIRQLRKKSNQRRQN